MFVQSAMVKKLLDLIPFDLFNIATLFSDDSTGISKCSDISRAPSETSWALCTYLSEPTLTSPKPLDCLSDIVLEWSDDEFDRGDLNI